MSNEILTIQSFLNKYSDKEWKYIPWDTVKKSLGQKADNPLCLIAVESSSAAGVDPYYGLPYHKYHYFVQIDKYRNSMSNFLNNAGQHVGPLLQEESGKQIISINYIPKISFTKSKRVFEVITPQPPIVHAEVSIKLEATFTPLHTVFGSVAEMNLDANGGLTLKANNLSENIISDFSLALDGDAHGSYALGVKSSVLMGPNGNRHFTSSITWEPSTYPGAVMKGKSEGKFTGSDTVAFQGKEWQIEYSLGYEVTADFGANKPMKLRREYTIYDLRVKKPAPVESPFGHISQRPSLVTTNTTTLGTNTSTGSWWERAEGAIITGGIIGSVLRGVIVVLPKIAAPILDRVGGAVAAGFTPLATYLHIHQLISDACSNDSYTDA